MNASKVLQSSLLAGGLLAAANFAYQSFLWFTGLNEAVAALMVFFLFFPIVIGIHLYKVRRDGAGYLSMLCAGGIVSAIGGLGILVMMYFYLNIVGGRVLPPVLDATIAKLEADLAAGEDVSEKLDVYQALTPTGFAISSAVQNAILGAIETVIIGAILIVTVKRKTAE